MTSGEVNYIVGLIKSIMAYCTCYLSVTCDMKTTQTMNYSVNTSVLRFSYKIENVENFKHIVCFADEVYKEVYLSHLRLDDTYS